MPYEKLSRAEITRALRRLGELAHEQEITLEVSLYGGAVFTLVYASRDATKDVDAVIRQSEIAKQLALKVARELGGTAPLIANMVEGGNTPLLGKDELAGIGFRLVIFPGGIVRALARTARDYYANLKADGTNVAFQDRMFDFQELNDMLGTAEMLEDGRRYEE